MSTIDKALDTLFLLSEQPGALRLVEIARTLGLPRSSAHRVLAPLVRRGLAEQDSDGRYRAGFALMALGLNVASREPIASAAKPVLERAAAELGETFFLVVARAGQLVVLEKAEGNGFLRAAPRLGSSVPVHATAVGKLYLAYAPELVEIEAMPRYTAATIRARKTLTAEVARVHAQGWATNLEEWQPGLAVAAAPIVCGGHLHGAVALAMVVTRFNTIGVHGATRRVIHAAEGIALRIEGRKA